MNYSTLKVSQNENVAEVILNQPASANAMNQKAWEELERVMDELDADPDVHVIILSGEGKHFCAGIDLRLLGSIEELVNNDAHATASEKIRKMILSLQKPINKIEDCSKPVLAAIHGGCIGAGLDIVAACDMRYCTEDSFFTIKEIDMAMV
ncbi:MAG TPA: enoyl-CoA hydratase-related protein, partial [Aequorivita sp.]|nr:enoyl-CoA hydratase-related protein [Aequorivita sp.]